MFLSILIYLFFWTRETKDPQGLYLWLSKMHLALYKRYFLNTHPSCIMIWWNMHRNDDDNALCTCHCFLCLRRHQIASFSFACHTWKFIMRFVTVIIFVIIIIFFIGGTSACCINILLIRVYITKMNCPNQGLIGFVGCQWSTKSCWSAFAN
jgi:hypothetical protein